MWNNFLDPIFGKNSPYWDLDGEKDAAIAILIDEVVVNVDDAIHKYNYALVVAVVQDLPPDDFDICFYIMKQKTVPSSINNYQMVNKKACIKHEVHAYLIDTIIILGI